MTDMESRAREYFPTSAWSGSDLDYILAFAGQEVERGMPTAQAGYRDRAEAAEAEVASLREKVEKERGYTREVADAVLRKIQDLLPYLRQAALSQAEPEKGNRLRCYCNDEHVCEKYTAELESESDSGETK